MNPNNAVHHLSSAVYAHRQLRDALMREYELEEGDQTLADTLEGLSSLPDLIAYTLRQAKEDEAMAGALGDLIADMQDRKRRLLERSERKRAAAAQAMFDAGETKLTLPDMTVSTRLGKSKLVITQEVPTDWTRQIVKFDPDKDKIKAHLEGGNTLPFAHMSNPQPIITVRTK